MGDTGEAFKAFNEIKREERTKKEPQRFEYAMNKLRWLGIPRENLGDRIIVHLPKGQITFWPYTGWFCGQKPYGKIKGRGIEKLLKMMETQEG